MKKLFLLLAAVGMIFTACDKENFGNNGNPTEQPGTGNGGGNGSGGSNNGEVSDPDNPLNNKKCASNEILYISKSCLPMELGTYDGWGANLTSNTYEDGVGRLKFDANVTSIPSEAFKENDLLRYIKMPNTIISIGSSAFYGCSSLTSVTIPDSVTAIEDYAFEYCTSLPVIDGIRYADTCLVEAVDETRTSYSIKPGTRFIGSSAFYGCSSLTSVTIPDSVTAIGYYAFSWCSSLTSITIPDSVTSIASGAFEYCTSLKEVYCKPTTPPTALAKYGYWGAFYDNASGRKIYVPRNSVSAYKTAKNWSNYADYIVGYDF